MKKVISGSVLRVIFALSIVLVLSCILDGCALFDDFDYSAPAEIPIVTLTPTPTPTPSPTPSPTPTSTPTPTATPTPTPRLLEVVQSDVTGGKKKKEVAKDTYDEAGDMIHRESDISGVKETIDYEYDADHNLLKETMVRSTSDRNKTTITEITTYDSSGLKVAYEYHYENAKITKDIVLASNKEGDKVMGLIGDYTFMDGQKGVETHKQRIDYTFDAQGRVTKEVIVNIYDDGESEGTVTTYEYDDTGALVTMVKEAEGSVQTTTYSRNMLGYLNQETNDITGLNVRARTTTTTYQYDEDHKVIGFTVEETGSFEKTYEYALDYVYEEYETEEEAEA